MLADSKVLIASLLLVAVAFAGACTRDSTGTAQKFNQSQQLQDLVADLPNRGPATFTEKYVIDGGTAVMVKGTGTCHGVTEFAAQTSRSCVGTVMDPREGATSATTVLRRDKWIGQQHWNNIDGGAWDLNAPSPYTEQDPASLLERLKAVAFLSDPKVMKRPGGPVEYRGQVDTIALAAHLAKSSPEEAASELSKADVSKDVTMRLVFTTEGRLVSFKVNATDHVGEFESSLSSRYTFRPTKQKVHVEPPATFTCLSSSQPECPD